MSKADEMFAMLGYLKYENDRTVEFYKYGHTFSDLEVCYIIRFYYNDKEIFLNFPIKIKELQAINEKVKELRLGINNK